MHGEFHHAAEFSPGSSLRGCAGTPLAGRHERDATAGRHERHVRVRVAPSWRRRGDERTDGTACRAWSMVTGQPAVGEKNAQAPSRAARQVAGRGAPARRRPRNGQHLPWVEGRTAAPRARLASPPAARYARESRSRAPCSAVSHPHRGDDKRVHASTVTYSPRVNSPKSSRRLGGKRRRLHVRSVSFTCAPASATPPANGGARRRHARSSPPRVLLLLLLYGRGHPGWLDQSDGASV